MSPRRRLRRRGLLAVLFVVCLVAFPSSALAHPAPAPVIAQVYGGGGNAGAQYQNDFIELFNRSGSPADLTGYSVQYAAATSATWLVTPLSGSLAIGQHLLVAEGNSGTSNGVVLPTPDVVGNTDLNLTSGKVALVSSFTPLNTSCPTGAQVLDLVGYGTAANCFEGSKPTPNASNVLALIRKTAGCTDTNDNFADFQALAPAPRNSASARNPCAAIPVAPTLTGTSPTTPGNSTTPKVIGTAPAGSTVELYTNAACSGAAAATGSAAQFASPGIAVTVAAESTTTFYALAFDAANTSSCSTTSVTYVEDSGVPPPPTLQATNPASPSNDTAPKVLGAAEAGSTVRIYSDAACTTLVATGTAAQFASPGIAVTVAPNATTTFYATATDTAGNTSPCSTSSLTYVEDSAPPPSPTLASSSPASPSNSPSPRILGSAESGSTVRIYTDAACTVFAGSGTAAQFASSGIAVAVAANSTTTFHATATDAVGNASACSTISLTYVEDSTPPASPILESSNPASPSNSTTPRILGSAAAGSTIRIYTDAACAEQFSIGSAAQFASPGIAVTVTPNSTTSFYATASDAVGNVSPCSGAPQTYAEDSAPPAQPTFSSSLPVSPSSSSSPRLLGSAETGSTVRIYTDTGCTELAATGSAAEFSSPGISVIVAPDSITSFYATARNAAGTASACSAEGLTYIEDEAAPAAPTFSASRPGSPGTAAMPALQGTAEDGSTVRIYTDSLCTVPVAAGSAAQFTGAGIPVSVAPDSTTHFYATATDTAGNVSACSSSPLTYMQAPATTAPVPSPKSSPGKPASGPLMITHLRVTPRNFGRSTKPTTVGAFLRTSDRSGARIRFTLSRGADVTFLILRAPRRRQQPGRLGSPAHILRRKLGAGAQSVPFSGRLGNRILPPGRYRVYVSAVDSEGQRSRRVSVGFRIFGA